MTAALTAASLSRTLRSQGFRPLPSGTPRTREGMRVQRDVLPGHVTVSVDMDLEARAVRIAASAIEVLRELGFTVDTNPHTAAIFTVTRSTR